MKRAVGYLIVTVVTLLIAAATGLTFGYFVFVYELLLGAALVFDIRYLRQRLTTRLQLLQTHSARGDSFRVQLELSNKGVLPMPEISTELLCTDCFSGKTAVITGSAALDRGETSRLRMELSAKHCGRILLRAGRVELRDHMGILSAVCPVEQDWQEVFILPNERGVMWLDEVGDAPTEHSEQGREDILGTDIGEDYEIREFRPGDTIRQVHWKLTAKTIEPMVHTAEPETARQVLILLSPVPQDGRAERAEWDSYLARLSALSGSLLAQEQPHAVVWMETKTGALREFLVSDEEDRKWMLCAVMSVPDKDGLGFGVCDGAFFEEEQEFLSLGWDEASGKTEQ